MSAPTYQATGKGCVIDGCPHAHYARGWCKRHYDLWRRRGSPHAPPTTRKRRTECKAEGCTGLVHARGYCLRHYGSLKRHGDALRIDRPSYEVDEHPDGYARLPLHDVRGNVVAHTKVDPIDAAWLCQWRWSFNADGYAYRVDGNRTLMLARVLLGIVDAGRDFHSDHINHDRLDNRRFNLRVLSASANSSDPNRPPGGRRRVGT